MRLDLSAAADRPLVPEGRTCERHLMLKIVSPAGKVRRLPLNLALVLDTSGSMSGDKLERAKEAAGLMVRHLTSADRVAIVAYNEAVTVVAPSAPLTSERRADLLYHVSRMTASGTTNLGGGWLTGCQEVAKHQSDDGQMHRVVLLTDGLANVGITSVEELVEHARQIRARGITTSTMGVGVDFNEELLEAMARHGGGRFQYVESVAHIPDCIAGELGEMLQVSARGTALELTLPEGVRLVECLNDYELERTDDGVRIHIGDLLAGDVKKVMLKLSVRLDDAEPRSVRALALYTDTDSGRGTEQAFEPIELRASPQEEVDRQPTNEEVAREVALLLAARAKEEAVRLSRAGEDRAAAAVLSAAQTALAASPYASSTEIASEMASLRMSAHQAMGGLSEGQRKEMRYQLYLARERRERHDSPERGGGS